MASHSKFASLVSPKNSAILTAASVLAYLVYRRSAAKKLHKRYEEENIPVVIADEACTKAEKAAVDAVFFSRLMRMLKIIVPGIFTQEAWYLGLVAFALITRTYCDVWMIQNGTSIESSIIGRDMVLFKKNLMQFVYAMPAIAAVNNVLRYGVNMLKLRFRSNLSHYLYDQYLSGFTYYKMSNLDNRIANADQLLTQDVEKFCDSVADLYTNLSKPFLDVILYTIKLTSVIGIQGPAVMLGYLTFTGLLLTRLRRPVGKMTVQEQKLEGEYRYVNSRLITNSEEIAFYQGNKKEHHVIMASFNKLMSHLSKLTFFKLRMGIVDSIIAKYIATLVGFWAVSRPFLNLANPKMLGMSHSDRLEEYYKNGRMLVKMAEAIGRIVLAGRELTKLSGFTARVTELMHVLHELNRGRYVRNMVHTNGKPLEHANKPSDLEASNNKPILNRGSPLKPGAGQLVTKDHLIRFEKVPLVTPNADVLIDELNFEVLSGQNVLVCGPNGCGKSSLFRILGELWPLFGGTLTKPDKGKLFYIPQRPYMAVGTLRDQVIYPDSHETQLKKRITDKQLEDILNKVQLGYILEREESWNAVQDWMDVLSGGEKQRIAMARLFYHRPQFAILDECTSAVSVDIEGYMYQHCREVGITLFTVSHRKSLWKHHEYYLLMDGRGSYEFKPITSDTLEFGS